jgi:hypothetical protein
VARTRGRAWPSQTPDPRAERNPGRWLPQSWCRIRRGWMDLRQLRVRPPALSGLFGGRADLARPRPPHLGYFANPPSRGIPTGNEAGIGDPANAALAVTPHHCLSSGRGEVWMSRPHQRFFPPLPEGNLGRPLWSPCGHGALGSALGRMVARKALPRPETRSAHWAQDAGGKPREFDYTVPRGRSLSARTFRVWGEVRESKERTNCGMARSCSLSTR